MPGMLVTRSLRPRFELRYRLIECIDREVDSVVRNLQEERFPCGLAVLEEVQGSGRNADAALRIRRGRAALAIRGRAAVLVVPMASRPSAAEMPLAKMPGHVSRPVLLEQFGDRQLLVGEVIDVLRWDHRQSFVELAASAIDDVSHVQLRGRLASLDRQARGRAVWMRSVRVGESHALPSEAFQGGCAVVVGTGVLAIRVHERGRTHPTHVISEDQHDVRLCMGQGSDGKQR